MASRKGSLTKSGVAAPRITHTPKAAVSSRATRQEAEYLELALQIDRRLDDLTARADRFRAKTNG